MANHYKQGVFTPSHPEKYVGNVENIVYRSGWERKLMVMFDMNENVLKWSSEEFPIPYWDSVKNRQRRYFVDFYVLFRMPKGELVRFAIEVKPYAQTKAPNKPKTRHPKSLKRYTYEMLTYQNNMDKWKQASKWCSDNNFRFVILHERNVGGLFK